MKLLNSKTIFSVGREKHKMYTTRKIYCSFILSNRNYLTTTNFITWFILFNERNYNGVCIMEKNLKSC